MLKKALACATLAAAATGATSFVAPTASASDTRGGDFSSNVSLLPHLCADIKRVSVLNVAPIDLLTQTDGQQCNEHSKSIDNHKGPLSDLIDAGAFQN